MPDSNAQNVVDLLCVLLAVPSGLQLCAQPEIARSAASASTLRTTQWPFNASKTWNSPDGDLLCNSPC